MTRPFDRACSRCGRRFTQPASLRVHNPCLEKRLVHLNHPYNRYECFKCGKKFKEVGNLRQHVTFHLEKMFHCLICGMDHYTKQQVVRHIQCEHHRVKSFACQEPGCSKRYTENRQLKKHWTATGHGGHSSVTETVSYFSEEDEDSADDCAPPHSYPPHPSPDPVPMHIVTDDTDSDVVVIPVTEAAAAPVPVVTAVAAVAPETDQLAEFLSFQKFLNMMRHCTECDGYFLSDELLLAHHLIHMSRCPEPEPENPVSSFEQNVDAVLAIEYPGAQNGVTGSAGK